MKSFKAIGLFCLMVVVSFFGGCFSQKETKSTVETKGTVKTISRTTTTKYANVYFRGTPNNWGTTAMSLIGDNTREITVYFTGAANDRFKVDVSGNWTEAYPAADFLVTQGAGDYKITFNETTKAITAVKVWRTLSLSTTSATINKGDTSFVLPTGFSWSESGHMGGGAVDSWSPALNVNDVGTTVYAGASSLGTVYFTLTVKDVNVFKTNYSKVYFRGTPNSWGTTEMPLVADNVRELTVAFGGATTERFKVDVSGNWTTAYPAADVYITAGAGNYVVRFDEITKAVTATKKIIYTTIDLSATSAVITKGDTTFALPATATIGQSGHYNSMPITWTPALDVNKVGTTIYTTSYADATATFSLTVNDNNVSTTGAVNVTVYGDSVVNGAVVSSTLYNCGVYLGDWHYGNNLGYTDVNGNVTVTLPAGAQELGVFEMTSSHSVIQASGFKLTVVAGTTANYAIHVAPIQVQINVTANVGVGNAVYLTGETGYLGSWAKAVKLTYSSASNTWSYYGNLPIGAQYKVVKSTDGAAEISTTGVTWEQGSNHTIQPIGNGYYESVNNITPIF